MAKHPGDRFDPLTKRQWATYLKKLGNVDSLKKKIDNDLKNQGMRRGMVYWIEFFSETKAHPYPHIIVHLIDKSGVTPFPTTHITYNSAITRLNVENGEVRPY